MKLRAEKLEKWKIIEDGISDKKNSLDWYHSWGHARELFYQQNGYIPVADEDCKRIVSLKNRFLGKRIFILGNGPSLNSTPLELLQDEFTFVTNRAYLLFDKIKWKPTFYTTLDWRVAPDIAHEINLLNGITCFFEERFRGILRNDFNTYWYTHTPAASPSEAKFSYNIDQGVRGAGSVTGTAVQIAFYLGFREIYLLGCDLGYKVATTVKQDGEDLFGNGVKIHLTSTNDDDANHFDPRYFGKDRRWHDPNVKRMISGHQQCLEGVTKGGGKIFNATVGGELEIYERVNIFDLLKSKREKLKSSSDCILKPISPIYPAQHSSHTIVGPFLRAESARLDESTIISKFMGIKQVKGVMIDVGAHRGTSCLPFAKQGWKVYAFEPDEKNRSMLKATISKERLNHLVSIDDRAVGDVTKSHVAFYTSKVSSGISGLTAFHESHSKCGTVSVVRLSEVLSDKLPGEKVDFLKIDTEGYDLFALKGFDWENSELPDVIECEFEDSKTLPLGYSFEDLAGFLKSKGYTVYVSEWHPIIEYGIPHQWKQLSKYPCVLSSERSWGNLVAIKNSTDEVEDILTRLFQEAALNLPAVMPLARDQLQASSSPTPSRFLNQSVHNISYQGQRLCRSENAVALTADTAHRGQQVCVYSEKRILNKKHSFFSAGIAVTSDCNLTIHADLCEGDVPHAVERPYGFNLTAGKKQIIRLTRQLTTNDSNLRIFLTPSTQKSCRLTFTDFYVLEQSASIMQRLGPENFNLVQANRLYQNHEYETAFVMYIKLGQIKKRPFYHFNAQLCASRLGLSLDTNLDFIQNQTNL